MTARPRTPQPAEAAAAGLVLRFWSPMRPIPKGSLKHQGRGRLVESNPRAKPHLELLVLQLNHARATHPRAADFPLRGPVEVWAAFFFLRGNHRPEDRPDTVETGDGDKLLRMVFDALTQSRVIGDDSQVVDHHGEAWFDRAQGTLLRVGPARDGLGARPRPGMW